MLQSINNIPAQIGAAELKKILFEGILPMWLKYTENFPLAIEHVVMRDKDWCEIHAKEPDRGVIAHNFYKPGKNGIPTFKTGRCLIQFHIPNNIYGEVQDWAEKLELERLDVCIFFLLLVVG